MLDDISRVSLGALAMTTQRNITGQYVHSNAPAQERESERASDGRAGEKMCTCMRSRSPSPSSHRWVVGSRYLVAVVAPVISTCNRLQTIETMGNVKSTEEVVALWRTQTLHVHFTPSMPGFVVKHVLKLVSGRRENRHLHVL